MAKLSNRSRPIAVGLGLMAALLAGIASAAPERTRFDEKIRVPETDVQVFVQLDTPSVAELNASSVDSTGVMASHEAQQQQAALVDAQQATIRSQLAALGATELGALRVGANGLRIRVASSQLDNIRALPGVRTVGRVEIHTLDNVTSVPWIGAARVWAAGNTKGQNVKVGIIDSGIDYLHANFGGPGTVAAYAANNKNIIETGTFPTSKVKGGIDLAGPTYDARNAASVPTPDADPLDGNGHGSHVAGTAAGLGVAGSIGPGVAPAADLYAIKVFNDTSGSTDLTSQGIEWALDPNGDADMSDHLDVINMSLGSPFGEPNDPSAISSDNASKLGIIVVASAGNEANVPYVTGAPAIAPRAISVAATTPGGRLYSKVTVTSPASIAGVKTSLEGAGPVTLESTGPIAGTLVPGVPANGCAALTNAAAISGNIAFIVRGTCGFVVKYQTAQAAGARAILVYNDGADATRVAPIVMGGLDGTVRIPGAMISSTTGRAIVAANTASPPVLVKLEVAPDATKDDQIAGFTSRGPGHGGSTFKPDLAAPGVSIVSTGVGSGTGSLNLQGTSMAAPHVAGAAALLHQLRPRLKPAAVKALLQNSTVDSNASSDTDLARQGVGSVRVDRAAALTSYASPGGISFGRLNPTRPIVRTESVRLTDFAGKGGRTFGVTHIPHRKVAGVQVSCPASVSVGSNRSREFNVMLSFDPAAAEAGGVFEDWFNSEREVDGWCLLKDGKDTLRVGYLASVDPASRMFVRGDHQGALSFGNTGPATGLADGFTLIGSASRHDDGDEDGDDERGEHGDDGKAPSRRIGKLGARTSAIAGLNVVEFGVALTKRWEHISNVDMRIFLDLNKDGVDDVLLMATDGSNLSPNIPIGTYVTAHIDLASGNGFIDWLGVWDFNDRVATLSYTSTANAAADAGFVPVGAFNYRFEIANRDGSSDSISGSADLSKEIVPDLNDFTLAPADTATVTGSRDGAMLWLFPGNTLRRQVDVERIGKREDHDD